MHHISCFSCHTTYIITTNLSHLICITIFPSQNQFLRLYKNNNNIFGAWCYVICMRVHCTQTCIILQWVFTSWNFFVVIHNSHVWFFSLPCLITLLSFLISFLCLLGLLLLKYWHAVARTQIYFCSRHRNREYHVWLDLTCSGLALKVTKTCYIHIHIYVCMYIEKHGMKRHSSWTIEIYIPWRIQKNHSVFFSSLWACAFCWWRGDHGKE